jgi:hypothetical protein
MGDDERRSAMLASTTTHHTPRTLRLAPCTLHPPQTLLSTHAGAARQARISKVKISPVLHSRVCQAWTRADGAIGRPPPHLCSPVQPTEVLLFPSLPHEPPTRHLPPARCVTPSFHTATAVPLVHCPCTPKVTRRSLHRSLPPSLVASESRLGAEWKAPFPSPSQHIHTALFAPRFHRDVSQECVKECLL